MRVELAVLTTIGVPARSAQEGIRVPKYLRTAVLRSQSAQSRIDAFADSKVCQ